MALYRERAWLLRSGMVPAEGKGMAFKVRHGLFIGKGHGLLVQAGSL